MYPLNTILIGCDSELLPHVRRELANCSAKLEAELPDVPAAVAAMRSASSDKRLFLVGVKSIRDVDILARLTTSFPGWPVVALVGGGLEPFTSSAEGLISIMRAGASQIVSVPVRADDFKGAMDRIAQQFVYTARDSNVVAVAGVTGGCGATTIAINIAFELAQQHGLRCILADLSLKLGVVATHLNVRPTSTILDLLRDVRRVDTLLARRTMTKITDNIDLLAGPDELVAPSTVIARDVTHVVDTVKQIADVVVLDVPCTYDDVYFEVLSGAGQVVLVGEPRLPSIRALKLVRESLARGDGGEHLVVNRYDSRNREFAADKLLKPLGVQSLVTIARDDAGTGAAQAHGSSLRVAAPRSPALADVVSLCNDLLAGEARPAAKPTSLLGRLGRAFSNA